MKKRKLNNQHVADMENKSQNFFKRRYVIYLLKFKQRSVRFMDINLTSEEVAEVKKK
jgi:hypothetical protein